MLDPLEGLTEDEIADGEDYFSVMRANLAALRKALGCTLTPAVELDSVSFAYGRGGPVLHDVNLRIGEGEFVAIAGPNGGGKTTLLRLVLGLERPRAGVVRLYGEPAERFSRRATLGYLPQRARS